MTTIPVEVSGTLYPVHVGAGLLAQAARLLPEALRGRRCAIVADAAVAELHGERALAGLSAAVAGVDLLTFPQGEASKSLGVAETLCEQLARLGIDRSGFIAALGGGVTGDLAGFVSAIHYRGLPYVQFPTTIVAQVDSSVGGKTGVNSRAGKNLIGAFHHPAVVIADTDTLATLPPREFNEGFAEIIKHAAIRSPAMLEQLAAPNPPELEALVAENVRIKAAIVSCDPEERTGLRALLNFGHTIGHALETCAGYGAFLHGEAISLGLVAAARLSVSKAGLAPEAARQIIRLLHARALPTQFTRPIATDSLLEVVSKDKKFEAGSVRFVLLRKPGDAYLSHEVSLSEIREAIECLRLPAPELA